MRAKRNANEKSRSTIRYPTRYFYTLNSMEIVIDRETFSLTCVHFIQQQRYINDARISTYVYPMYVYRMYHCGKVNNMHAENAKRGKSL